MLVVGVAIITVYNFQGTSATTEGYAEKIQEDRDLKDEEFKTGEESPLTDEQKTVFTALSYFPVKEKYNVQAEFHKEPGDRIIKMDITDGSEREYYEFGNAHIHLEGKEIDLTVYKPVKSDEDYLFIPFYDNTSADLTYGGGRYVEPEMIDNRTLQVDFNLAYNPYCAYNKKYRCPIPPRENSMDVSILAGEKLPEFVQ